MAKKVKMPGRIESTSLDGIVAGAAEIFDDGKGKMQNVINTEVSAELLRLKNEKQDNLTIDNVPTEDSQNPVTSGGVFTAEKALSDAIEAILILIPSAATALNQLADKSFVESSLSTATATFRGTYNVVSDLGLAYNATHEQIAAKLGQVISTADNNDYCFVQVPGSATSTDIKHTERYKFNGSVWAYEYDLNNSGFTASQWAAINSNITALLVAKLIQLPTAEVLATLLAGKQDNLTFDERPTAGSDNPVKSGGVYASENEIIALINALELEKQDKLTFDSTPTNGSSNPVTSGGVYEAIYLVQVALASLDNRVISAEHSISVLTENVGILRSLYQALTSGDIIVGSLPTTGVANTVYRVPGVSTYADWMYYNGAWVKLAEYTTLDGYLYKGIATPSGSPAASAVKMFYFALTAGTYTNFGGLVCMEGINILKYDGANWTKEQITYTDGGVFDISVYHATGGTLATYAELSAALDSNNDGGVPQSLQKGGMSIKFVRSSDNKYVQYRLMATSFSTTISDWQGVDNKIISDSNNLAKSGSVSLSIKNLSKNILGYIKETAIGYYKTVGLSINDTYDSIPFTSTSSYTAYKLKCNEGDVVYIYGRIPSAGRTLLCNESNGINTIKDIIYFSDNQYKDGFEIQIPEDVNTLYISIDKQGIGGVVFASSDYNSILNKLSEYNSVKDKERGEILRSINGYILETVEDAHYDTSSLSEEDEYVIIPAREESQCSAYRIECKQNDTILVFGTINASYPCVLCNEGATKVIKKIIESPVGYQNGYLIVVPQNVNTIYLSLFKGNDGGVIISTIDNIYSNIINPIILKNIFGFGSPSASGAYYETNGLSVGDSYESILTHQSSDYKCYKFSCKVGDRVYAYGVFPTSNPVVMSNETENENVVKKVIRFTDGQYHNGYEFLIPEGVNTIYISVGYSDSGVIYPIKDVVYNNIFDKLRMKEIYTNILGYSEPTINGAFYKTNNLAVGSTYQSIESFTSPNYRAYHLEGHAGDIIYVYGILPSSHPAIIANEDDGNIAVTDIVRINDGTYHEGYKIVIPEGSNAVYLSLNKENNSGIVFVNSESFEQSYFGKRLLKQFLHEYKSTDFDWTFGYINRSGEVVNSDSRLISPFIPYKRGTNIYTKNVACNVVVGYVTLYNGRFEYIGTIYPKDYSDSVNNYSEEVYSDAINKDTEYIRVSCLPNATDCSVSVSVKDASLPMMVVPSLKIPVVQDEAYYIYQQNMIQSPQVGLKMAYIFNHNDSSIKNYNRLAKLQFGTIGEKTVYLEYNNYRNKLRYPIKFDVLSKTENNGKTVKVLHVGDSFIDLSKSTPASPFEYNGMMYWEREKLSSLGVNMITLGGRHRDLGVPYNCEAQGGWRAKWYATKYYIGYLIKVPSNTDFAEKATYSAPDGVTYQICSSYIIDGDLWLRIYANQLNFPSTILTSGTLTRVSGGGESTIPFSDAEKANNNPFWDEANNKLDFVYYARRVGYVDGNNIPDIDVLFLQFMHNDVKATGNYLGACTDAEYEERLNYLFTIVDTWTSQMADVGKDTKVVISIESLGVTNMAYNLWQQYFEYIKRLFVRLRSYPNVIVIPVYPFLDPDHSMPEKEETPCPYYADVKEILQYDGHPHAGWQQYGAVTAAAIYKAVSELNE